MMVLVLLLVVLTMGMISIEREDDTKKLVVELGRQWHGKQIFVAGFRYCHENADNPKNQMIITM